MTDSINVSQNGKTAETSGPYSTVHAAWVPRDGTAAIKFKVDAKKYYVRIRVVTEHHSPYNKSYCCYMLDKKSVPWVYHDGDDLIADPDSIDCLRTLRGPSTTVGSSVTVSLAGGQVTFSNDQKKVYSFILPQDCGRISLDVTLGNAKVTIV